MRTTLDCRVPKESKPAKEGKPLPVLENHEYEGIHRFTGFLMNANEFILIVSIHLNLSLYFCTLAHVVQLVQGLKLNVRTGTC